MITCWQSSPRAEWRVLHRGAFQRRIPELHPLAQRPSSHASSYSSLLECPAQSYAGTLPAPECALSVRHPCPPLCTPPSLLQIRCRHTVSFSLWTRTVLRDRDSDSALSFHAQHAPLFFKYLQPIFMVRNYCIPGRTLPAASDVPSSQRARCGESCQPSESLFAPTIHTLFLILPLPADHVWGKRRLRECHRNLLRATGHRAGARCIEDVGRHSSTCPQRIEPRVRAVRRPAGRTASSCRAGGAAQPGATVPVALKTCASTYLEGVVPKFILRIGRSGGRRTGRWGASGE